MKIEANSPEEYIEQLSEDRQVVMNKLRKTILDNLPNGFEETMIYNMIGYVVPHTMYPGGYHVDPTLPLPFINIASQKNFIAVYHMGVYAIPEVMDWFVNEYPNHSSLKLNMGKSCIRFKNINKIPYELLGELVSKITAQEWVEVYEAVIKK